MSLPDILKKPTIGKKFWVFLHPYVYVCVKPRHAILYNSLNGYLLEYKNDSLMVDLLKRLNSSKNLYVIRIDASALSPEILNFVAEIRKSFSGDIMEAKDREEKPINFKPIPSIQKSLEDITTTEKNNKLLARDDIYEYLNTISLYVTNKCEQNCIHCSYAYKQCIHCYSTKNSNQELSLYSIEKLIAETQASNLSKLNILGGNILEYSQFSELIHLLRANNLKKEYYINVNQLSRMNKKLEMLAGDDQHLNILVRISEDSISTPIIEKIKSHGNEFSLHCLIEEDENIEQLDSFLSKYPELSQHISVSPFYNGKNIDFFKETVFLTSGSITEAQPSLKDIFARQTINSASFKQLYVRWDGAVYANMNHPKIGNINSEQIYSIINNEINNGRSWWKLRKNVNPCKSCPYNALCPPISNFEYVLKRNNLCHIL